MDFEYSSEQKLLWDSVHRLMQRVATPEYLRRLDRERLYPYELYDAWVQAGLFALPFAEEYGGAGGSVVDLAIVSEEIGRYSADVAMAFGGSIFLRAQCGAQRLRGAETLLAAEADFRRNPHVDLDVGAGCRLRCRRHAHAGAPRRQ